MTGAYTERGIKGRHGFMTDEVVDLAKNMHLVPRGLADIAVLTEPLTIAEKALNELDSVLTRMPWIDPTKEEKRGLNAVVLGAGPVGLLGALALLVRGFDTWVYSRESASSPRAAWVESVGARYIESATLPVAQLGKRVGNVDLILEATGAASLAFAALPAIGKNGIDDLHRRPGGQERRHPRRRADHARPGAREPAALRHGQRRPAGVPARHRRSGRSSHVRWPKQVRALITGRFPPENDRRRAVRREGRHQERHPVRRAVRGGKGWPMADIYDVIIIGTGAGGGTLAAELAPFGKRILLLERGGWLPRERAELERRGRVRREPLRLQGHLVRQGRASPFNRACHYFVGGATKMYGAALYRLRERDFGELRHQDGLSPAWPISYAELEPYYTRAENLYQVHGARGEDPTEPPASAPYPFPAVSHEPRIQQLHDDLARAGYRPFHTPCGIMLNESNMPFSKCVRCMECDGFPCLVHAKSDAEVIAVRPALQFPNVTLLTSARALQLKTNPSGTRGDRGGGRARRGATRATRANIVVVSCGAANSAPCCSRPRTTSTRAGLANGSDQVGRNYMCHNNQAVLALSKEPNPTKYQKTLGMNDFYFERPEHRLPARQHPDGRQVTGADVPRREEARQAGADVVAGEDGQARASTSGSAPRICRGPRTGSRWRATAASASATPRPTRFRPSSSTTSSSRCWGSWACTRST